jgi:hypothetical protein
MPDLVDNDEIPISFHRTTRYWFRHHPGRAVTKSLKCEATL